MTLNEQIKEKIRQFMKENRNKMILKKKKNSKLCESLKMWNLKYTFLPFLVFRFRPLQTRTSSSPAAWRTSSPLRLQNPQTPPSRPSIAATPPQSCRSTSTASRAPIRTAGRSRPWWSSRGGRSSSSPASKPTTRSQSTSPPPPRPPDFLSHPIGSNWLVC